MGQQLNCALAGGAQLLFGGALVINSQLLSDRDSNPQANAK